MRPAGLLATPLASTNSAIPGGGLALNPTGFGVLYSFTGTVPSFSLVGNDFGGTIRLTSTIALVAGGMAALAVAVAVAVACDSVTASDAA